VFQHNLPVLCEHLETENIQPKQYVYEWFMTLFTRALNFDLVSRVWDFYFLDGIFILYQTAIGISIFFYHNFSYFANSRKTTSRRRFWGHYAHNEKRARVGQWRRITCYIHIWRELPEMGLWWNTTTRIWIPKANMSIYNI